MNIEELLTTHEIKLTDLEVEMILGSLQNMYCNVEDRVMARFRGESHMGRCVQMELDAMRSAMEKLAAGLNSARGRDIWFGAGKASKEQAASEAESK